MFRAVAHPEYDAQRELRMRVSGSLASDILWCNLMKFCVPSGDKVKLYEHMKGPKLRVIRVKRTLQGRYFGKWGLPAMGHEP